MGTESQEATAVDEKGDHIEVSQRDEDIDAAVLYVLQSQGSWLHCGYHLTTSIVAPPLLNLPYAVSLLGWNFGMACLIIGALLTFYSYNLISLVLEHHADKGHRHLRFQDMANHILGQTWGQYFVGPIQLIVCYGAVVGLIILGGECMKIIYSFAWPDGKMELHEFVIIYGIIILMVAQMPSFHSLRYINLISLVLSLSYSACATAGSIYIGNFSREAKDYSISGNMENRIFGSFTAIGMIATSYGNGIIPEIQATLAPPVKGKMFKGLCLCYVVVAVTFFSVAVSGYWAFGNRADSFLLYNFVGDDGKLLVPKWFFFVTLSLVIIQISAVSGVYLQPTNVVLEKMFIDPRSTQFSARNVTARVISRSISVALATIIAVVLPFFGDLNALIGAIGFLPLDFILPMFFFNLTFHSSNRSWCFWLNYIIAFVFSIIMVISIFTSARQIVLDAKEYHLFNRSESWNLLYKNWAKLLVFFWE